MLIESALGELVERASEAVATLRALLGAEDERVRLGAAKATLEQLLRLRETLAVSQRLAALERAQAKRAGRRADLRDFFHSWGCVDYEHITGSRAGAARLIRMDRA